MRAVCRGKNTSTSCISNKYPQRTSTPTSMESWTAKSNLEPSQMFRRTLLPIPFAALLTLTACGNNSVNTPAPAVSAQDAVATATPIKHVVVIFGENVSFDHYFGTYPQAANPSGEPQFVAAAGTPT